MVIWAWACSPVQFTSMASSHIIVVFLIAVFVFYLFLVLLNCHR